MKKLLLSSTLLLLANTSTVAYELIDLGAHVAPRAINNTGVIVGSTNTDQYPPTAFRWSAASGYEIIDGTSANAVNEDGIVTGSTMTGAFILDGINYLAWNDFDASGINHLGAVAGYKVGVNPVEPASLPYHPAIYDDGQWSVFDIAETYPRGTEEDVYADRFILNGINDVGYSVGYKYRYGLFGSIAILIDPEVQIKDKSDIVYLSIPEGGKATDINNSNMIVGTTGSNTRTTPAIYRNAYMLDYNTGDLAILPLLEGGLRSSANDINEYNQVVGSSETLAGSVMAEHAFLWNQADGVTVDLNDWAKTGWVLTSATAINDNGDIVGTGTLNGVEHGFLLTLLPTDGTVPEPPPSENTQPVANDINVAVDPGSALTINVLASAADSDGDLNAASVQVTEGAVHGITVVNSNGTVDYMPDAGYEGTDNFSYTVEDNDGALSNVASVNISVKAAAVIANDAAPAPADAASGGALSPVMLVWIISLFVVRRLRAF
jgi:probable HAF family extracellular repeat protein